MNKLRIVPIYLLCIVMLAACGGTPELAATQAATEAATNAPSDTPSPSPSPTATDTPEPSPTPTATPTPIPTYVELRGQVVPEKLSCRFGPGPSYLYKYGILATTNIEILGRMEHGDWVLVQAIGGDNPCWVKADLLDIDGDVQELEPLDPHIALVWSPYYGPPTGASAVRDGDSVTLSWHPLVLIAGDDSEQVPYVVEAWLCQDGVVRFEAIGTYYPEISVTDETGCATESDAWVSGAEKHGYTLWSPFEWPGH